MNEIEVREARRRLHDALRLDLRARTHRVEVSLTEDDLRLLLEAAEVTGATRAACIREAIRRTWSRTCI